MKYSKATLKTIIFLLIIFVPLTVIGAINRKGGSSNSNNPNHEFKYNNQLYYYDEHGNLLGIYKCETDNCGNIITIIDDDTYKIDYYKDGSLKELSSYDAEFAFLQDGEKIHLYNLSSSSIIFSFDAFKNYNTNLKDDLVIVKQNGKWGVLSLTNKQKIVKNEYDFIGLKNSVSDELLNDDTFIAMKDNKWFLLKGNEAVSIEFDKVIKSYTNDYIITQDNAIYNYQGIELVDSSKYKDIYVVDNYILAITSTNIAVLYTNPLEGNISYVQLEEYTDLRLKLNDNKIDIYNGDTLMQSIEIS